MNLLWDYMEHFRLDENGKRWYSASAFEEDDAVLIRIRSSSSGGSSSVKPDPVTPPAEPELPFVDVAEKDWFFDAVEAVYEKGLMAGVSESEFDPYASISRAMVAQILYSMEGKPAVSKSAGFSDVAADAWYADAVNWAAAKGIVSGYGDGKFGPSDIVTREQLALMLLRYAQYKDMDTKAAVLLDEFKDAEAVSYWAADAMEWAVGSGLIAGTDYNELLPTSGATRAQGAVILNNFSELAK